MLVGGPHPQQFPAVLDVFPGGAAAAVKTLSVFHGQGQAAGHFGVSGVQPGASRKFAFIVSDDAVVHGYEKVCEFLVDGIGQTLYRGASRLQEADLADDGLSFRILEGDNALLGQGEAGFGALEDIGSALLLQGVVRFRPVAAGDAVTGHQSF